MLKKKNFYKKRIIKFLIVWAIISYILIMHCTRNVLAYSYRSSNKYDVDYVVEMFVVFLVMIYSLWGVRRNYIRYIRYKKMKVKEGKAMVTSFDGAVTRGRYLIKYRYSYKYNVDNNTYIRKECTVEKVYNNGDIIRILYDTDNPEESITEEEYNRFTKKSSMGFYLILFGFGLALFLDSLNLVLIP